MFVLGGRVVLWPDRLQVPTRAGGHHVVPWHELAPGGPHPPPTPKAELILKRVTWPATGAAAGRTRDIVVRPRWTAVDPAYLADAIRYYVEHPQYRDRIGQAGEQQRLHQAIMELRAATGTPIGSAS